MCRLSKVCEYSLSFFLSLSLDMLCICRAGHMAVIIITDMNSGLFKDANSFEENNQEPKCGQITAFMMTMKPGTGSSDNGSTSTDST